MHFIKKPVKRLEEPFYRFFDCWITQKPSAIGKEDSYERNPSGVSFVCNHRFFRTFQVLKNRTQLVKKFFDKL